MFIADLHIHSRYSRATSRECTPEHLDLWARRKGISLLGSGDFTHPQWRRELEEKLAPAQEGLYVLKEEFRIKDGSVEGRYEPRFVISGEISSIYKKNGKVRKVHNVILLPGLGEAGLLAGKLEAIGNIHSDGRPILGLDSRDLLEITLEICPRAIFVPAHIWTPHFSMFGAFSGFDTIEECFEDLTPHIRAFETGLSSDPPMNWRLSALDGLQMISNSDAHSPAKLGREANLLDIEMSYEGLYGAIQEGRGLAGTIEFFPEEGKYHYDGHRKCHLCLSPQEAEKYQGICPVCGRKLTMGVSHRIEQLADRKEGFVPVGARHFESLVPLPEVIGASIGHSAAGVKVGRLYQDMLKGLGAEFSILREIPEEDIQKKAGSLVAEGIRRLRRGNVRRFPGFDGEYGVIKLFEPWELETMDGQMTMFAMANGLDAPKAAKDDGSGYVTAADAAGDPKESTGAGASGHGDTLEDSGLNEEQLQAVQSNAPRIAVVAGPGTGKTKTLVSRILYLLQNRRVRPSEITAVTFTNKAAQEMRERLKQQLGGKKNMRNLRIGTFHSICQGLLKASGETFVLVDEGTAVDLAGETAACLGIKEKPQKVREMISRKRTALEEEAQGLSGEPSWLDQAARLYEEKLAALHGMDFDDLLLRALVLSRSQEQVLKGFAYLLVDEFQDISPLQYRLIQAWSGKGREVFIIGDPDQAIYGFRGADSKSFHRFQKEKDTQVLHLKKNYRSTPQILDLGRHVLNGEQMPEPVLPDGIPVSLVRTSGEMGEAILVAKEINRLVGGMDMLDMEAGFASPDNGMPRSFKDIAVLYRTHRQAELLEKCLKKEGIPYVVAGREDFLMDPQVQGSMAFFRSILDEQDHLARRQCLKLLWKVDEDCISRRVYEAMADKYVKMVKRARPGELLSRWREDMGFLEDAEMEKLCQAAVFYKTMGEMADDLAFGQESDLRRCGGKAYTADSVTLMTFHGSKGLEFPAVILYGVRKGLVPLEFKGRETDWEEERRLLYVAVTRAKEELIVTRSGEGSMFMEGLRGKSFARERIRQKQTGPENGMQLSLFDLIV